jgi:hypothetical protein
VEVKVLLAGSVNLGDLVDRLRRSRPVFHSEADLQHAVAWVAHEMDPRLQVRLETHPEPNVRLDLLVTRADLGQSTAVELKYITASWTGEVTGERFVLANHGAQDVRAYDVVKDLERVERFVAKRPGSDGLVMVLSNDPSYWVSPRHARETNAKAFRLHDGNLIHGTLAWGPRTGAGTSKGRESALTIDGQYMCTWTDFTLLPGHRGQFRLLAIPVPRSEPAPNLVRV